MVWDPFCPFHLYCSLESGEIVCIDIRIPLLPLCSFQAHDKTTSGISFSSGVSGLFASASIDKTVKLWDVSNIQKTVPGLGKNKIPTGVAVEVKEFVYQYIRFLHSLTNNINETDRKDPRPCSQYLLKHRTMMHVLLHIK